MVGLMSLRLVMDQSHGEFLKNNNTQILQALLTELDIIIFPLIDRPLTLEKIQNDHILFIGCPSISFQESEIQTIVNFVEMGNFLILISGSGGDFANNTNLSKIARWFEFEFNPDYVEDEKHCLNFSRIPIIHNFKKSYGLFKSVKKIVYSGCSITILDPSTSPILLTDSDSIPIKSPVMVLSENHLVFGIGGYSLFSDDPLYGIKALDNLRFVYNLFELIRSRYQRKKPKIKEKIFPKPIKMTLKSAKKHFLRLISSNIQRINELSEEIDKYWENCSDLINKHQLKEAEAKISAEYQKILKVIDLIAAEIGDNFNEYNYSFPEFKQAIQNDFTRWYEIEAEIRAKLDIIRNNLISKLKSI